MDVRDIRCTFGPTLKMVKNKKPGAVRRFVEDNHDQLEILLFEHTYQEITERVNAVAVKQFGYAFDFTPKQIELLFEAIELQKLSEPAFQQFAKEWSLSNFGRSLRKAIENGDTEAMNVKNMDFPRDTLRRIDELRPNSFLDIDDRVRLNEVTRQIWSLPSTVKTFALQMWDNLKT